MRSESAKRTPEATRQKAAKRKPKFRPGDVVEWGNGEWSQQLLVESVHTVNGYDYELVVTNEMGSAQWLFTCAESTMITLIHRPK